MDIQTKLLQKLDDAQSEMIEIRRYLHEHPEVSFKEKATSKYIKDFYQKIGCDTIDYGEGYGFVVDINGGKPGKKLALRADFDALAVQEDNDLPFKSKNDGVMHACGHDGHTAYMMILARALNELKDELTGSIRIIHQPAEEVSPGGAKGMLEAGVLDGVDNVIGIHVMSSMPTGSIGYHQDETQTGRANFTIKIKGHGGHASMPHLSNDAIVAGAYFVTALQTVVSRRIDPFDTASVTIGSFDGTGSYNAIKEDVVLKGDVRVMKETTRKTIRNQILQISAGLEKMFGVKMDIDYDDNYPVLVNDAHLTQQVVHAIKTANLLEVKDVFDCGMQDPSEDFAYFAQDTPSCFYYVGCQPEDGKNHPHHSPDFMMNEDCLIVAAKSAAIATLDYLAD
jgi:amidohydrolase